MLEGPRASSGHKPDPPTLPGREDSGPGGPGAVGEPWLPVSDSPH